MRWGRSGWLSLVVSLLALGTAVPAAAGPVTLTPIDTVMVWFQQDIATSTMFSSARSMSTEIDLTSTNTATRLYKGGQWSTPS